MQPLVTLTNTYDAVGNRISLADDGGVSGAVTGYAFDGAGRLTQLTTPSGQPIDLGYDPAGRVTELTFPNTVTTTIAYDLVTGRLSQLTHNVGANPLADFGYGYNDVGNITQIAELAQTRDFAYDDLQRLTAGGTLGSPESYAYDPEGNRTASHLSANHTTDTANRLTEDDDFTYAYDANGNLTSKTATAGGAVTSYSYDAQDELTRIDFPDLTFAAYRYDGLGRRIEKDVAGAVTQYIYDGSAILLEYDGAGALLARYSHGQGIDQPLAVERDLDASGTFEAGEQFYYQADHQGSLRKITDAVGVVANSYDYDAYGNIEAATETLAQPYSYTGRELDAESGLYYYRARYYDPTTGRFLAEDPIGFRAGDANLYRYVFNNPVNFRDPSGLDFTILIGGGGSAVAVSGVEASSGIAISISSTTITVGTFGSVGIGGGVNVSADLFVGGFFGSFSEIEGTTFNQNLIAGPVSLTGFFDPDTGGPLGGTIGVGPSATPIGGSTTVSFTAPVPLFSFGFGGAVTGPCS